MLSICKKILSYGAAALIALPSLVSASETYHHTGSWSGIDLEYNPFDQTLSMDYSNNINAQKDDISAFWLVLTEGPMPVGGQAVQLIGDMESNTVTAYSYLHGQASSGAKNYEVGEYLASYQLDDISNGFEINVAALNAAILEMDANAFPIGVSDDEKIGIWMKGGENAPEYKDDGSIKNWKTGDGNYHIYDKKNLTVTKQHYSTAVSEPAAILALLAAAGIMRVRKKKDV